ncbi:hypothetical protein GQ42DRAFT_49606 [Ramicandelaber brevisporus]|nr:hypothetical protein GQ42DRAFT_49606 [Ramicandelaber brevisporus]
MNQIPPQSDWKVFVPPSRRPQQSGRGGSNTSGSGRGSNRAQTESQIESNGGVDSLLQSLVTEAKQQQQQQQQQKKKNDTARADGDESMIDNRIKSTSFASQNEIDVWIAERRRRHPANRNRIGIVQQKTQPAAAVATATAKPVLKPKLTLVADYSSGTDDDDDDDDDALNVSNKGDDGSDASCGDSNTSDDGDDDDAPPTVISSKMPVHGSVQSQPRDSEADDIDNEQPKRRKITAICKYWRRGHCRNGDACQFSHDTPQSNQKQKQKQAASKDDGKLNNRQVGANSSLIEKLYAAELERNRRALLYAISYIVSSNFFDDKTV